MYKPSEDGGFVGVSLSAEIPSDMLGQNPSELLSGLNSSDIAATVINFTDIDTSGIDFDLLNLDPDMFGGIGHNMLDGAGDIVGSVADIAVDTGSSVVDMITDIFSMI